MYPLRSGLDTLHETNLTFRRKPVYRLVSYFPYVMLLHTNSWCNLGRHFTWEIQVSINSLFKLRIFTGETKLIYGIHS